MFRKELVLAAFDYTAGGVLSIKCESKHWILVAYLLNFLNEIERNYEIHDKKILAVIRGLENWRHLLEDAKFKFKVQTDHKNLEYFMKTQKLNRKQACQALYLSGFNFTLKYIPGTKIEKIDRLSKQLD